MHRRPRARPDDLFSGSIRTQSRLTAWGAPGPLPPRGTPVRTVPPIEFSLCVRIALADSPERVYPFIGC